MIEDYEGEITVLRYHVSWPGTDPFYLYNIPESNARRSYYGVNLIPWAALDGTDAGSYSSWENRFLSRLDVPSPIEIDITSTYNDDTREAEFDIDITATDIIEFENLRFHFVVIENDLYYGNDHCNQVMRDMVVNGVGTIFQISEGETVEFDRDFILDEELEVENCQIIVFIQDRDGSKEMLQSITVPFLDPLGVDEFPQGYIPSTVSLLQNYPNPFNASTNITFDLREKADVNLSVYNVAGQKVADIANGKFEAGSHTVNWDASGEASGVYFYKLNADGEVNTQRMVLMK